MGRGVNSRFLRNILSEQHQRYFKFMIMKFLINSSSSIIFFVYLSSQQGRVIGIIVGCLLGMIPLMFMNSKEEEDGKKATSKDVEKKDDSKPKNENEN